MLEEVMNWLCSQVLPTCAFEKHNKRGHRHCIQAKKEFFDLASKIHFQLGLPMTDCSLFYRGVNFERKHVNVFGLSDEDLKMYRSLKEEDEKDVEATLVARKKSSSKIDETGEPTALSADSDKEEEEAGDMNKTRVEKLADKSVIEDLKKDTKFPKMDLDLLVMGPHQLSETMDLPWSLDFSDLQTITGTSCLKKQM